MKNVGVCCTDGSGYWSDIGAAVVITHLDLAYLDDETLFTSTFGELRAYFDPKTWDIEEGLIYTDEGWIRDFCDLLIKKGFSERAVESVCYSEQGMQGRDYVSMDVGDTFIIECDKFMNFVEGGKPIKVEITVSALD